MGEADVTSCLKLFRSFQVICVDFNLNPNAGHSQMSSIKVPAQLPHSSPLLEILFETHRGKMGCILLSSISAVLLNLSQAFPATVRATPFSFEHLQNVLTHSLCIFSFHRCCPLVKVTFYSTLLRSSDPQNCTFCLSLLSDTFR